MKVLENIKDEQKALIEACNRINNEMHDKQGWRNHDVFVSCTFASCYIIINMTINQIELPLYCSANNDDRIYYEKSDKYENWYPYIKRKFREVKEQIYDVKL